MKKKFKCFLHEGHFPRKHCYTRWNHFNSFLFFIIFFILLLPVTLILGRQFMILSYILVYNPHWYKFNDHCNPSVINILLCKIVFVKNRCWWKNYSSWKKFLRTNLKVNYVNSNSNIPLEEIWVCCCSIWEGYIWACKSGLLREDKSSTPGWI